MTKVKTMFLSTLILLVTAAAGMYYLRMPTSLDNDTREKEEVIVWVIFEPGARPRTNDDLYGGKVTEVEIRVSIDGFECCQHATLDSAWSRPISLPKGALLELTAWQQIGNTLACKITKGKETLDEDHDTGPSAVKCTYEYGV